MKAKKIQNLSSNLSYCNFRQSSKNKKIKLHIHLKHKIIFLNYKKMSEDENVVNPCDGTFYPYFSLVVQFFMTLSLLIIAILRFINTRSQLRINKIKDEYYANKSKKKWKNIEIS